MKTIIAGGRNYYHNNKNYEYMLIAISNLPWTITEVVSGNAQGADMMGEKFAREHDLPLTIMEAEWDVHGKSAGYLRNEEMAKYADACVCFWDGESKGTEHMINIAKEHDELYLRIINYHGECWGSAGLVKSNS